MKLLKTLTTAIKQYWFISLIVAAALSLLAFFGGPFISVANKAILASTTTRLLVITVIVFLWGILNLAKKSKKEKKDVIMEKEQVNEHNNIEPIPLKLISPNAIIQIQHKSSALKNFPCFVMVGKNQSGKTSLVNQTNYLSEAENNAYQGIKLWVNDQMLILEVTESLVAESTKIEQLLSQLSSEISNLLFSGVILAKTVSDLLDGQTTSFAPELKYLKKSITSNFHYTHTQIPIYLIVTHMDTITGFHEYTATLNTEKHEEALALSLESSKQASEIKNKLSNFISKINYHAMNSLLPEADSLTNTKLISFASELSKLKDRLYGLLEDIIINSEYSYEFYGIYLTAYTTDSTKNLEKKYFIKDIFNHHLTNNHYQSMINTVFASKSKKIQLLTLLLCTVTLSSFSLYCYTNYAEQEQKVNQLQTLINSGMNQSDPWARLASAKAANGVFIDSKWKLLSTLGLYRGIQMHNATEKFYEKNLYETLLPFLKTMSEEDMKQNASNLPKLYNSLVVYLMLNQISYRDKEFMEKALLNDWNYQYASGSNIPFNVYLTDLLALNFPAIDLNQELVSQSRAILNQSTPAQYAYWNLEQAAKKRGQADLNINMLVNNNFTKVFTTDKRTLIVPWLYTADGYKKFYLRQHLYYVQKNARNNWVLGNFSRENLSDTDITQQIDAIYSEGYINAWENVINQIKIIPINNFSDAINTTAILSGANSPLRNLLQIITTNTQLKSNAKLTATGVQFGIGDTIIEPEINNKFHSVNSLTITTNNVVPLANIINSLAALHDYLENIASASNPNEAAFNAIKLAMNNNDSNVFVNLKKQADQLPEPIKTWVDNINNQSLALVIAASKQYINVAWQNNVYSVYQNTLANRYPFSANSTQDATLADFSNFFSSGGVMQKFITTYIAPLVDMQNNTWQPKQVLQQQINFDPRFVAGLQQANQIAAQAFPNGVAQAQASFSIKPTDLSSTALQSQLTLGNQVLLYRHDPQQYTALTWPSGDNQNGITLLITGLDGNQASLSVEGPWAWYKLVHQYGQVKMLSNNHFILQINVKGFTQSYDVINSSVTNIFSQNSIRNFVINAQL
jgi:type VI secretion system protein ImpL